MEKHKLRRWTWEPPAPQEISCATSLRPAASVLLSSEAMTLKSLPSPLGTCSNCRRPLLLWYLSKTTEKSFDCLSGFKVLGNQNTCLMVDFFCPQPFTIALRVTAPCYREARHRVLGGRSLPVWLPAVFCLPTVSGLDVKVMCLLPFPDTAPVFTLPFSRPGCAGWQFILHEVSQSCRLPASFSLHLSLTSLLSLSFLSPSPSHVPFPFISSF